MDEYHLEDIARHHPIGTAVFLPFAVLRLREQTDVRETTLTIRLLDIDGPGETQRTLHLSWSPESELLRPAAIQDRSVTEWAACGVACAVVSLYTGLQLLQVAREGDRFDFLVGDGEREFGLEVSGTVTEDVATRHRLKVQQLLDNPYGLDGYVVVVGFTTREVMFSFHRFAESVS